MSPSLTRYLAAVVASLALLSGDGGCELFKHTNQAATESVGNQPVRHETGATKTAIGDADKAVANARNYLSELARRFQAYLDDPAHNPAPTPQETVIVIRNTDQQLQLAQDAHKKAADATTRTENVADHQQQDFDTKLAQAVDKQYKADRRVGQIVVSLLLGLLAGVIFERVTHFTMLLVPIIVGGVVGGVVFALFNFVLDKIQHTIDVAYDVAVYGGGGLLLIVAAVYVRKRLKLGGGLWGLIRNVELAKPAAVVEPDAAAGPEALTTPAAASA